MNSAQNNFSFSKKILPRLNMAIPSPAFDRMEKIEAFVVVLFHKKERSEREREPGRNQSPGNTKHASIEIKFGEGVCCDEEEMHMKGIDARDEVKGEEGNGEDGDKAIDAGALVGGEKLEVFDGGVSKEHGEIEGNYCIENVIKMEKKFMLEIINNHEMEMGKSEGALTWFSLNEIS
ncbi:hypothetical protein M5K25_000374 [Dendrobium thyrsiflorum]|uniref:Uncharacterized protein n=1 Tax=Dendrobium thyrsiflorum TaxID=117978 RepID=A0ABD0VVG9_DENTH